MLRRPAMIAGSPTRREAAGGTLHAIQAARFVAALLVVLFHAGRMLPVYMRDVPAGPAFGRAGVDFFFVLSGFIIMHAHAADIGRPRQLTRYLWRRLTRIYPIYWVVTLATAAAAVALGHADSVLPASHVLQSLLLVPHRRDPIIGVAWTLSHEMLFYLVFATLILRARLGMAVFALWLAATLVGVWRPFPPGGAAAFLFASWHMEFMFGMAMAWLFRRGGVPVPWAVLSAGLLGFAAAAWAEDAGRLQGSGDAAHFAYGAASALLVLGLASAGRPAPPLLGALALRLGAWSYGLYLVHVDVIGYLAHGLSASGLLRAVPAGVVMAACAAVAVAVAAALHRWVERPLGRALHGGGRRRLATA